MNIGAADKKKDQAQYIVAVCVAVVALTASGVTLARDIVVGGGVSVGYEFDDRQYEDDDEVPADLEEPQNETDIETDRDNRDERYSRFRLSPLVTLNSSDVREEIELSYSPSFWYDVENSDNEVDHDLFASLSRYLTRDWRAKLTDRYRLSDIIENRYGDSRRSDEPSDDTAATGTTAGTTTDAAMDSTALSDTDNRRRYWTNDLALLSEYKYRQDSMFMAGYNYGILENIDTDDGSTLEDYDRHEVLTGLGHRFDPVWKMSVFGSYVRGLIDRVDSDASLLDEDGEIVEDDNDLKEYRAATILQADYIEHHSQALEYSFYAVDYDAAENKDATIQDVTLGWQWDYAKDGLFSLGAGPTYVKTEDMDGEWGYNARMLFSYEFERGSINFSARRGYEVLNFTGTNDNGLRKFWQSILSVNYRLLENLSADLYTGYRYEDEENIIEVTPVTLEETAPETETSIDENVIVTETINRKRFSTGLSFGYSFLQWYKLRLSYDYSKQDSEAVDDSFDEHKVALTLSYETELFKW